MLDIYVIRARYTSPDNRCKPEQIARLAPIAIAHDIASLVGEVEACRSTVMKLTAEVDYLQARLSETTREKQT